MKTIKKITLFIIFLLVSNFIIKAQAVIQDTTINTDIVSLPVYGTTADWENKTIEYSFKTNWVSFQLLDVVADNNSAVLDKEIEYKYEWENNSIIVTIHSIKPNFNGTLFNIVIRVLPKVDFYFTGEFFEITPMKILVSDGEDVSSINLGDKTAQINFNYIPANLTYRSDVSLNYPNPFSSETFLLFSLSETKEVNFEIYNVLGTCVQNIPGIGNAFRYEIIDSKHNLIAITENNTLEKGLYRIKLIREHSKLAKGVYYLVVRIGDENRTIRIGVN
jgi:hypothetical protein